jgi:hypothetical protein
MQSAGGMLDETHTPSMILKIAVLASGAVLADSQPVELDKLEEMLQAVKAANGSVWYYREPAASTEYGMRVVQLVVKHKVAISISSKADYSDYLDSKGVSHPRVEKAADAPGMPEVAVREDIEQIFRTARRMAAGEKDTRGLVLVGPDRRMLVMPALETSEKLNEMAVGMERLIPSSVKRNIAVIAYTGVAAGAQGFNVALANREIPFLGLLTGLTYIGHAVWIFEGHESALAAGCRDADVLIVDSGMLPHLVKGWDEAAVKVMRNPNILIHDRTSFKLRFARKAGDSRDRLEFPR